MASTFRAVWRSHPLASVVHLPPAHEIRARRGVAARSGSETCDNSATVRESCGGWSLPELSRRTGIDAGHLSRIENGKRPPTEAIALACDAVFPERRGWFGAEIMAAQMRHLAEAARLPRVTVQVLPAVAHPATQSGFMVADGAAYAGTRTASSGGRLAAGS